MKLAGIWKSETDSGYDRNSGTWAQQHDQVIVVYGALAPNGNLPGQVGVPDPTMPFVEISESPTLVPALQRGVSNYTPPEGSLLIVGDRIGVMKADGLHLSLEGSTADVLIAAAKTLEPMPT